MGWRRLICAIGVLAASGTAEARGVTEAYRPGEEVAWVFSQGDTRIGEHTFRYEGPVALPDGTAHHFTGRVRILAVGAQPVERRYTSELWTDEAGRPLRHLLHVLVGDTYSGVELTFSETRAKARVTQGPTTRNVEAFLDEPVWVLANNFIGYFELIFRLATPDEQGQTTYTLFSSNAVRTLPYSTRPVATPADAEGSAGHRVIEDSLGEQVTLDDAGHVLRLELPAQKLIILRSEETLESFTIEPPEPEVAVERPFEIEEVRIEHGEVTLAGEITRPRGAAGRLGSVLFISGSGLQDRNGISSGIDVGTHEILDRLTQEGLLVLRVDDRGTGGSVGPLENLSYADLVSDARAALDFLSARDDVDPRRVALIGHSEGGTTAPILAAERPEIAAVVLMAASGRSLVELILDQNAWALDEAGVAGEERERTLADVRRYLDLVITDDELTDADLPPEYVAFLGQRAWLRDHAAVDTLENVKKLRCPVLILQGGEDFQILVEEDARPLARALEQAGNPDVTLEILPGLDHLFKKVQGDRSSLAQYFERRPVDSAFLDLLSAWLLARLQPAEAKQPAVEP